MFSRCAELPRQIVTKVHTNQAHLCQDLPGHDDNLHRLEGDVSPQPLDHPSSRESGLARHDVGEHASGSDQDQHGHHDCKDDATGAVGALAACETWL